MIFWNFKTPVTLFFCFIWNTCETLKIGLGKYAPKIFSLASGINGTKIK